MKASDQWMRAITEVENCGKVAVSEDYANFIYGRFSPATAVCEVMLNFRQRVFYQPLEQALNQGIFSYGYSAVPKLYSLMDDTALERSGITQVQNQTYLNLRGKDTLVGIIDTGIDYRQPYFKDAAGNLRIERIWDQTLEGKPPTTGPFYYGTEFTKEELETGAPQTEDEIGHGTRMAMLAAGAENKTAGFIGAAPEAGLVIVKLRQAKQYLRKLWLVREDAPVYQEDDILIAFAYLLRIATELQRPMVMLLGMGTTQGGHDRAGELGNYVSQIGGFDGIIAAVPTGNEAGKQLHYFSTVEGEYEDIELRVTTKQESQTVNVSFEIWARDIGEFTLSVTSPSGETTFTVPVIYGVKSTFRFALLPTKIDVYFELVQGISVRQMAFLRMEQATVGIWKVRVYKRSAQLRIDAWLPPARLIDGVVDFLSPNPDTTITDIGNDPAILTIGAYDVIDDVAWLFSGRGFASNGIIKPDIVAPGVNISVPKRIIVPNETQTEQVTGTSYALALAGGACALLLEWGLIYGYFPNLNTQQAKNLLIRGARVRGGLTVPDKSWGYGALDLYHTLTQAGSRGNIRSVLEE